MSDHDLSTMLRDYVGHDEPPPPMSGPAMRRGRRIRRRNRWTAVAGGVALVAAIGSLSTLVGGDGPDRDRTAAVEPTPAPSAVTYDAHQMPRIMDEHVRAVLARTADPGPSTFEAYDSQSNPLPERYWDKASQLEVTYGSQDHSWDVSILHSRGEAEGDPEDVCSNAIESGLDLSCTVRRSGSNVVVTTVIATRPERAGGSDPAMWMLVDRPTLATADVSQVWFARTVKVIKSQTLITYVTERVKATSTDPADAQFTTPVEDLVAIATDAEMVMPEPPTGANGCPQWSLHQEQISCSG